MQIVEQKNINISILISQPKTHDKKPINKKAHKKP